MKYIVPMKIVKAFGDAEDLVKARQILFLKVNIPKSPSRPGSPQNVFGYILKLGHARRAGI